MSLPRVKRLTLTAGAGSVVFSSEDLSEGAGPEILSSAAYKNFINIMSVTSPTAGTFTAYAELAPNAGFHRLADLNGDNISAIDATKTGAEVADGEALGWEYYGPAHQIKVIAAGVTGPAFVDVQVNQFI